MLFAMKAVLKLSDDQLALLHARVSVDEDASGDISWTQFVLRAPALIREVCEAEPGYELVPSLAGSQATECYAHKTEKRMSKDWYLPQA